MSDYLTYKGYKGTVEYSAADDLLYGKIIDIPDLFMYDGDSLVTLKKDFQETVDDYIAFCEDESIHAPTPQYKEKTA